jgi:hypothetical protein
MARIITKVYGDTIRVYDTEDRFAYELDGTDWSAVLTSSSLTFLSFGRQIGIIYTDQSLNLGNSIFGYTVPANVPPATYNKNPGTSSTSGNNGGGGTTQVTTIAGFLNTPNKAPGSRAFLRLVADGVPANTPTFPGYKLLLSNWNNGAGISNLLEFFFDGVDHYLSVNSAIGAIPADVIAPARVGLPVLNSARTQIAIAYDEPITGTVTPGSYVLTGATITSLSIVGQSVVIVVPAITAGATVTLAYTGQTIVDGAGNPAPTFAAIALDTSVAAPVFNNRNASLSESNGVYTPGTALAWDAIGASSTPIFVGAATFDLKVNGNQGNSGLMMAVDADAALTGYATFDYGIYKEYNANYKQLTNGSFAAVTPSVAPPQAGAILRLARDSSNTLRSFFSHDNGASFTLIHNFGVITSAPLYVKVNGFNGTWSNVTVS